MPSGRPRRRVAQPLNEVFGYRVDDFSPEAIQHRAEKLCPFNNTVATCTKVSVEDPLGVCSINHANRHVITCPVRLRQDWRIIDDTQGFLLPNVEQRSYLPEIRLRDKAGNSVGKFDVVMVDHVSGKVRDFGALEIQAVYISGNVRNPFRMYMENPAENFARPWLGKNSPHPDWLSSVKRLLRQLTVKCAILKAWNKRMAVAVQSQFFVELGLLNTVREQPEKRGEMGWYLYDIVKDSQSGKFGLQLERKVYMTFDDAMKKFSALEAGIIDDFTRVLEKRLAGKDSPPIKAVE